jgi:hypothetical protein
MEAAGVTLCCWCVRVIVIKIIPLHYLLLVSPSLLCDNVFFFVWRLYVTEATTQSLINMYPLCIHFQVSNFFLPKSPR